MPWLLKDPRPHQVKQTRDESYINHYSVYCTARWIYVHESQASVMCQWNRQYYGRKHYWHFSFLYKCFWLHIMPKAVAFFSFFKSFFISALWAQCHNAIMFESSYKIKKKERKDRGLLARIQPGIRDVSTHKNTSQRTNWCHWRQLLAGLCQKKRANRKWEG